MHQEWKRPASETDRCAVYPERCLGFYLSQVNSVHARNFRDYRTHGDYGLAFFVDYRGRGHSVLAKSVEDVGTHCRTLSIGEDQDPSLHRLAQQLVASLDYLPCGRVDAAEERNRLSRDQGPSLGAPAIDDPSSELQFAFVASRTHLLRGQKRTFSPLFLR